MSIKKYLIPFPLTSEEFQKSLTNFKPEVSQLSIIDFTTFPNFEAYYNNGQLKLTIIVDTTCENNTLGADLKGHKLNFVDAHSNDQDASNFNPNNYVNRRHPDRSSIFVDWLEKMENQIKIFERTVKKDARNRIVLKEPEYCCLVVNVSIEVMEPEKLNKNDQKTEDVEEKEEKDQKNSSTVNPSKGFFEQFFASKDETESASFKAEKSDENCEETSPKTQPLKFDTTLEDQIYEELEKYLIINCRKIYCTMDKWMD